MNLPFMKKQEEDPFKMQMQMQKDTSTVESAMHPQNMDEDLMMQRRSFLAEITQWLQDCEPRYIKLFNFLSGVQFDDDGSLKMNGDGTPAIALWITPKCNLNGAYQLVKGVETIDHNIMNGNWEQGNIARTLKIALAGPIKDEIKQHYLDYGIAKKDMKAIFWQILRTVEGNYYRGWNDGERRLQKEITKVNEIRTHSPEVKKRAFFS